MRHTEVLRCTDAVRGAVARCGDKNLRRGQARKEVVGDARDGPSDGLPRVLASELLDRQASTLQVEFLVQVGNRDAQVRVARGARPGIELNRKTWTEAVRERVDLLLEIRAHLQEHIFARLEQDFVKCVSTALLHVPEAWRGDEGEG